MALNTGQFLTDLTISFTTTGKTWAECAADIASAIKTFIESGTVTNIVNASGVQISGMHVIPWSGTRHGTGGRITGGNISIFTQEIISSFSVETWNTCATQLGNAICNYIKLTSVVIPRYIDASSGDGFSTEILCDPGLSSLISSIQNAFTSTTWSSCITLLEQSIYTFVTQTNMVQTTDSGTGISPVITWSGLGEGTII